MMANWFGLQEFFLSHSNHTGRLPPCHQASVTFATQLIRILRAPQLLKHTKWHKVRYGQMSASFYNFFPLLSSPPLPTPQGPTGGAEDVPGERVVGAVPGQVQLQHLPAPRECTTVAPEARQRWFILRRRARLPRL